MEEQYGQEEKLVVTRKVVERRRSPLYYTEAEIDEHWNYNSGT
jgi:hypothetical protein